MRRREGDGEGGGKEMEKGERRQYKKGGGTRRNG